jgi:uncharacterized protein (TIGR03437 family)
VSYPWQSISAWAKTAWFLLAIFFVTFTLMSGFPHRSRASQKRAARQAAEIQTTKTDSVREAQRRELEAKLRDPRFLILRTAIFDPLQQEPEPVRVGQAQLETTSFQAATARLAKQAANQADESRGYFIVQYRRAIQPAWADSLRARGCEIAGYLPNNAYIIKASPSQAAQLQSTSEVRWVGAYGMGLKVEPELAKLADAIANQAQIQNEAKAQDAADVIHVSWLTFRGENASPLREAIAGIGPTTEPIIEERNDGRVWGIVAVRREDLPQLIMTLAAVEGIEWIEQRRPRRLHNDNGVRAVQTGFVGSDTPLYRNGLTGAGQVYGTADSGLDSDHAQFKLDGNASSQTLSFATTTASLTGGLLPFRITNQNNKVLSYYLLGSSGFKDLTDNPNGGKTLDPERASGTRYLNAVAYDDSSALYHGTLTTSVAVGRNYGANGSGALPGIPTRSTGDGVAPDAKIVFQDVGHPSGQLPGVDFVSQLLIHQQAYSSGARIHNNSYGPEPPAIYDQDAADVDEVMWRWRDYTIFFSAGNDSPGAYQVTNAAKNNIVVGATDSPSAKGNLDNLASYSNHGPTFDGRIKPDIVAPGDVIGATEDSDEAKSSSYSSSTSATAKDAAVNPTDPNNNSTLTEEVGTGTSFASAMAAGGALLVRQYFTDGYYPSGAKNAANVFTPSNALIKALVLNSGRNLTGRFTASNFPVSASGPLPNFGQGWGRPALDDALYFAGDRRELKVLADIYNGATATETNRPAPNPAITTGQTHTYQLTSVSNVESLRITLVWSDPRAAIGSVIALVNNLNLEVVDPQGRVYRGNTNFTQGWSQTAGSADFDTRNPVEAVYIQYPIPGTYTVRVIGENVPGNGQTQIIAQPGDQRIDSNRQGYALIATGNFSAGAQPVLNLATTTVNGGVNADPFISANETVTATVAVTNPSSMAAQGVNVRVEVDSSSQVPASLIRINGGTPGEAATVGIGDVAAGTTRTAAFQITLLDDGQQRVGQTINLKATMTPSNGLAFTTQFTILAQLKLITYRTRFEPAPDPGGAGIIVIPESDWKLRPDNPNRADKTDPFDGDWKLSTAQRSENNNSTASLGDPSGDGAGYGVSKTSRDDGQVFDDSRWWTPKMALPGLVVTSSTGLVANPEDAAKIRAEIDSFDVDIKADFTGDVTQSSSSGDFVILRVRTYDNTVSIRSTDDSGATTASFTNLLYLDSNNVATTGFRHYSGSNFASGDGVFAYEEDEDTVNESDVFFRFEAQLRRNGFPQTGEGVFIDNLVVRLRVADTAVYASPTSGALTTVDAASYERAVAPGQIVAAFGSGFPSGTNITAAASSLPLPTELEKVSVRVNGAAAPLFFVGAGGAFGSGAFQINYQLPFETTAGVAFVEVLSDGRLVASEYLNVSGAAPGIFTFNASGEGQAAVLNQDYSPNGDPARNPQARPEARGRYLIVYATGQGDQLLDAATRQLLRLPSGYPAPAGGSLIVTADNPTVTIGGALAQVSFSGLAPGFVGLWQLNVLIPNDAATGLAVPLSVSFGERDSRTTTVAVN